MCELISHTIEYLNNNMGITTIIAGTITAIATFMAVFLTSWFDRKARKYEYNNKFYQDKLMELNDHIGWIELLNKRGFDPQITSSFRLNPEYIDILKTKLNKSKKIINYLILLNPKSCFTEFKDTHLNSLEAFLIFLNNNTGVEFKNGECKTKFKEYIEERDTLNDEIEFGSINYENKSKIIEKMKTEIRKEFKLDR